MSNAEVAQLIKQVRRNGFTVEVGEGSIAKVLWKGEQVFKHEQDGGTPVTIHMSPSDVRWRKNIVPILVRAKVLESDPWASHTERKLVVTSESAQAFVEKQLRPWVQRRYDEGFPAGVLANAIHTRWPELAPTQNAVAVALSNIMLGKQKGLTAKKHKAWREVVEGWSKNPALPPRKEPKAETNGHGESAEVHELRPKPKALEKPSIPLSAQALAMMMDSYPDRDEALLLYLGLVELEEHVYGSRQEVSQR